MKDKVFIHPTSEVKSKSIGKSTRIWQFCVVLEEAIIGQNCNINANVFIENDVKIGNNVTIKSGVQVWDCIEIENDAFIGPNVTFTNDLYPRSKKQPAKFLSTIVKEGASIGANSTILPGLQIGKFSIIGAGSVVTKDVEPFSLMAGNPARKIGKVSRCGSKVLDVENTSYKTKNTQKNT
jgi:UDP-2-acetamido-3-amino-2,3-dideoxy-glucuronate N-acetyltransferase